MKKIDNIMYYTTGDISQEIKQSQQTIWLWDKYSKELEAVNKPRLIPAPALMSGRIRYYTKEQVDEIIEFSKNIKRGDLVEFSWKQWGKIGEETKKRKVEKNKIDDVNRWRVENRMNMIKEG